MKPKNDPPPKPAKPTNIPQATTTELIKFSHEQYKILKDNSINVEGNLILYINAVNVLLDNPKYCFTVRMQESLEGEKELLNQTNPTKKYNNPLFELAANGDIDNEIHKDCITKLIEFIGKAKLKIEDEKKFLQVALQAALNNENYNMVVFLLSELASKKEIKNILISDDFVNEFHKQLMSFKQGITQNSPYSSIIDIDVILEVFYRRVITDTDKMLSDKRASRRNIPNNGKYLELRKMSPHLPDDGINPLYEGSRKTSLSD